MTLMLVWPLKNYLGWISHPIENNFMQYFLECNIFLQYSLCKYVKQQNLLQHPEHVQAARKR
jgi:hypothetical protein